VSGDASARGAESAGAVDGGRLPPPLRHPGARLWTGAPQRRRRPRQDHGCVAAGGASAPQAGAPALRRRHGSAGQHGPPAHPEGTLRGRLLQQHGPEEAQPHQGTDRTRARRWGEFFTLWKSYYLLLEKGVKIWAKGKITKPTLKKLKVL